MMRQGDEQIEGACYPIYRIKGVWGFAPCLPGPLPFGARTIGRQPQPDAHALSTLALMGLQAPFGSALGRLPK